MPDLRESKKLALEDRFSIQRELGEGGIATAHVAEDLKQNHEGCSRGGPG